MTKGKLARVTQCQVPLEATDRSGSGGLPVPLCHNGISCSNIDVLELSTFFDCITYYVAKAALMESVFLNGIYCLKQEIFC